MQPALMELILSPQCAHSTASDFFGCMNAAFGSAIPALGLRNVDDVAGHGNCVDDGTDAMRQHVAARDRVRQKALSRFTSMIFFHCSQVISFAGALMATSILKTFCQSNTVCMNFTDSAAS